MQVDIKMINVVQEADEVMWLTAFDRASRDQVSNRLSTTCLTLSRFLNYSELHFSHP